MSALLLFENLAPPKTSPRFLVQGRHQNCIYLFIYFSITCTCIYVYAVIFHTQSMVAKRCLTYRANVLTPLFKTQRGIILINPEIFAAKGHCFRAKKKKTKNADVRICGDARWDQKHQQLFCLALYFSLLISTSRMIQIHSFWRQYWDCIQKYKAGCKNQFVYISVESFVIYLLTDTYAMVQKEKKPPRPLPPSKIWVSCWNLFHVNMDCVFARLFPNSCIVVFLNSFFVQLLGFVFV